MKSGKTLTELAKEIEHRSNSKRDFIADTRQLRVVPGNGDFSDWDTVNIEVKDQGSFPVNSHFHNQVSGAFKIPKKYYDRMLENDPNLLALNVNHWMTREPKKRMIRTMERPLNLVQMPGMSPNLEHPPVAQVARAFLSDRYRVIDNEEILTNILPVIGQIGDCKIESCDVTETRLWLKVVFPWIETEVKHKGRKVGDVVQAGIVIGNSEIGAGATIVDPLVYRLSCLNGARYRDYGMSKYHLGRISGEGKDAVEFFKDETLRADDRAFMMKLTDVVRAAADQVQFNTLIDKISESTENEIEGDPVKAVEVVQKKFGFNDSEQSGVLQHLIKGGDLSQYGLSNAVTAMSQDVDDYDRASDIERMGGQIIELPKSEWKTIAVAKAA
jgi:hypothetical protein